MDLVSCEYGLVIEVFTDGRHPLGVSGAVGHETELGEKLREVYNCFILQAYSVHEPLEEGGWNLLTRHQTDYTSQSVPAIRGMQFYRP